MVGFSAVCPGVDVVDLALIGRLATVRPGAYTYLYFLLLGFASCLFFARTPGQAVLGMGVARVDEPGRRVDLWRSAVRVLMTGTIFLAAMVDSDGRGVHDRVTGTAVIRG